MTFPSLPFPWLVLTARTQRTGRIDRSRLDHTALTHLDADRRHRGRLLLDPAGCQLVSDALSGAAMTDVPLVA
ncbi:hypothetical protein [Mycobacterium lepromatosis]|uniref:hypothetical protein n=1 Tax=Mycobacterium lepromatosis TaxID=480418 RepID=UPI000B076129|nr:hypothetical protein [Mycobacterium lepromatosis]